MLSSELKESFETANSIHRAQRRLQQYQDNDDDPRKPGVDAVEMDESVNDEHLDSTLTDRVHISKKHKGAGTNKIEDIKDNWSDKSVFEELEARKFEAALAAAVTAESEILNLSNGIAELEAMLQSNNEYAECTKDVGEKRKRKDGSVAGNAFDDSIINEGRFPILPSMVTCFRNTLTCSDGISMPVKVDLDDE